MQEEEEEEVVWSENSLRDRTPSGGMMDAGREGGGGRAR